MRRYDRRLSLGERIGDAAYVGVCAVFVIVVGALGVILMCAAVDCVEMTRW